MKKQIIGGLLVGLLVIGCGIAFVLQDKKTQKPELENKVENNVVEEIKETSPEPAVQEVKPVQPVQEPKKNTERKIDLYSDIPDNMLPLSSIALLADTTENVRHIVGDLLKDSDRIYVLTVSGDKVIVITEAAEDIQRHGINIIKIDMSNDTYTAENLSQNTCSTKNGKWEYDKTSKLPLRHTKYNDEKEVEYTEVWNYSEENPVKYELKDSEGKIISLKKETISDNGSDMRVENLVYDGDGNTKLNVSVSFEGQDITHFTYYNAENSGEGVIVISEYEDGVKIKETVYTSDYKVKNSYKADYTDGLRTGITVFDSQGKEVEKLLQE